MSGTALAKALRVRASSNDDCALNAYRSNLVHIHDRGTYGPIRCAVRHTPNGPLATLLFEQGLSGRHDPPLPQGRFLRLASGKFVGSQRAAVKRNGSKTA